MDLRIALFLAHDGIISGAVYTLIALALVLVFSVTRVILIPQGEFVTYGALSMAALQAGATPATLWMLLITAAAALAVDAWRWHQGSQVDWRSCALWCAVLPTLAAMAVWWQPQSLPGKTLAVLLIITPLGPLTYRLAFRPLSNASVLALLMVSVALHWVLVGLGLWFFGAEGSRTSPFSDARFDFGGLPMTGQSFVVIVVTALLVLTMFVFFERTLLGKALRATAVNRVGARLMGIPTELSGDMSFALAAMIGAVSGLLISPITTIYYDSGFLIATKGFVAAIMGGISSYPLALLGAVLVGQLEAFASFWASAFKEVLVFTVIIPVLLWRSLRSRHVEDEE